MPVTYLTFGQDHRHELNGCVFDKDCIVVFPFAEAHARLWAFTIFGDKFFTTYNEKNWKRVDAKLFPRGYIQVPFGASIDSLLEETNKLSQSSLTFAELAKVNRSRCDKWHPNGINSWSLSDWAVAMAGEVGEACDVIKKLNRDRDGLVGNKLTYPELRDALEKELADILLYLDLLAQAAGMNLEDAVVSKFNEVSERLGMPERLCKSDSNV